MLSFIFSIAESNCPADFALGQTDSTGLSAEIQVNPRIDSYAKDASQVILLKPS
jgi:hypothetical protein